MPASPTLPLVLVTHTLPPGWLASLTGRCGLLIGPENANGLAPELAERLADAEGLFCLLTVRVDEPLLSRAPQAASRQQHGRRP